MASKTNTSKKKRRSKRKARVDYTRETMLRLREPKRLELQKFAEDRRSDG